MTRGGIVCPPAAPAGEAAAVAAVQRRQLGNAMAPRRGCS